MRNRVEGSGITVYAIAGTHVVVLGIDIEERMRDGLRGFAVHRHDRTEDELTWMKGLKTFKSVEPNPAAGVEYSSLVHPLQTFQWADFSAKPGYDYEYEIVAMYGAPAELERRASLKVRVSTEKEEGDHKVYFNRGSPATQEYARKFMNRQPDEVGPAAFEWLSRGLLEGILAFIARAEGPGWSLKGAFYEFQWPAVLDALAAAKKRGVDVSIVFDQIAASTAKKNKAAITTAGIGEFCTPRTHGKIMHNKFVVLSDGDGPRALLFGSTNLTANGIFGHANCAHVIEGPEPATAYLAYQAKLMGDPATTIASGYEASNARDTPAPVALKSPSVTPVFSPRPDLSALKWYADLAGGADKALMMTFAFGMHQYFHDVYMKGDGLLRMALMEKEWNGANAERQIAAVRQVQALPNVVVAIGNRIPLTGFDQWLGEIDHITKNTGVHWVHTKFMLVDPLGDDPIVITGSANFSKPSTDANDENMVVIRGERRVADIYVGEYFRLYSHYAFREAIDIFLKRNPTKTAADFGRNFLVEDADWTVDYFTPGDRNARFVRRRYFSGL